MNNGREHELNESVEMPGKGLCPFVSRPFDNCLLFDMTSSTIGEVVKYCDGDYRQCAIYRERTGEERKESIGAPIRQRMKGGEDEET